MAEQDIYEVYVNNAHKVDWDKVNIQSAIKSEKERCDKDDLTVMWYHGKLTRNAAEGLLHEVLKTSKSVDTDGTFLVRDNSGSEVDYALSFLHQSQCYHFFIKRLKQGFYSIDSGPEIQGLDMLIEHYMDVCDRLPTKLSRLCKGELPPSKVRKIGPTNILHMLVNDNQETLVREVLDHKLCPDLDMKNEQGSTALHLAASQGFDPIVSLLLGRGADPKCYDAEGATPLHTACMSNRVSTCELLVGHDATLMQEKNPLNDWVPLHAAAMLGHTDCVKRLLNFGAALYPRGKNQETPVELATNYRRVTARFLENYKEPNANTIKTDWFHPDLDRQGAESLLQTQRRSNGMFLVSRSESPHFRLSLCVASEVKHYRIKVKEYRGLTVHFMDDGPYHTSLEGLVAYYSSFSDGLTVRLQASVPCTNAKTPSPSHAPPKPKLSLPPPPPSSDRPSAPPPRPRSPPKRSGTPEAAAPPPPASPTTRSPPQSPVPLPPQKPLNEINKKHIKLGSELGAGEFGSVYKGFLTTDKKFFKSQKKEVAIKTFHSVSNLQDFKQEAEVMASLDHAFIVRLMGVCYDKPLMLVEEFVPMGSILTYLEDYPAKVSQNDLELWAAQMAEGMMYLETQRLVHRDLAARNILLMSQQHVKISDFGLSRAMNADKEYYKASKGGRWPIKWYAPESVNYGHFSHASDVWSYGVTLWEMFSYAAMPYEDMSGVEVIKFIEDEQRLGRPDKCPEDVYDVMLRCWSYKKEERPKFKELNAHFDEEPIYSSTKEVKQMVKRSHKSR